MLCYDSAHFSPLVCMKDETHYQREIFSFFVFPQNYFDSGLLYSPRN